MGYLSNGAIWLNPTALFIAPKKLIKDLDSTWKKDTQREGVYYFTGWNWDDAIKEIKMWEDFMIKLEKESIPYDFIRLGTTSEYYEIRTGIKFYIKRSIGV
ncbi:MAG TPA: hypothetical protein ENK75_05855 [Saprospiraceae bacterium]|nr:hypothetical protein [Saprospiraceae bacterium]